MMNYNNEKVMYIPKDYIKDTELKKYYFVKEKFSDETLGKLWRSYDFEKAEKSLFKLQCNLSKATYKKNKNLIIELQNKICFSSEAKMLAVRKVSEISKSSAGIDKVIWRKDSEKMKAAICLNNGEYIAKPLKQFIFTDKKSDKKRQVGIPTFFDRAMQVLYAYSLDPVSEATADRKSFAFRKGRSSEQVHALIMHCLTDINPPQWILITDISSYYDTISHKWLLDNIPIKKRILKQFLNAGFVLNGELFNKEEGISLGSNLSTILGNMTLDGLQKKLYDLQGTKIKDYYNGFCIRYADDILITARTENDARNLQDEVKKFAKQRGLTISQKKTKIVNIKDGFEFLSRFYYKSDVNIICVPSPSSVKKFEYEVEEMIFDNMDKWSQTKLIQNLNAKIVGYATYHKCEESMQTFKHLDVIINALLLNMMQQTHRKLTKDQIIKRYWKKDCKGRQIFTVPNTGKSLKNMADTILVNEYRIDTSKNVFLDKEYFDELENYNAIQNCAGKYKKLWNLQEGVCYICSKKINQKQEKAIIYKNTSNNKAMRNKAYVHSHCKDSIVQYVTIENEDIKGVNLKEVLAEIDNTKKGKKEKEYKFANLTVYFHNLRKNNVKLTLKGIERILGFKLCKSAYTYKTYFTTKKEGTISESWLSQGFKVKKIDLEKQTIEFTKFSFKRTKVIIPKFMYRTDLPTELVDETKIFFQHLQEKYGIR